MLDGALRTGPQRVGSLGLAAVLAFVVGCSPVWRGAPAGGATAAAPGSSTSVPVPPTARPVPGSLPALPVLSYPADRERRPAPLRTGLSGFPAAAPAADPALRVHSGGDAMHGLAWQLAPARGDGDGITLESAYLERELPASRPDRSQGYHQLWSTLAAASAWDGRLNVEAEYARARRRSPGARGVAEESAGEARQLRAAWKETVPALAGRALAWTLALEHSAAERGFRSPGGAAPRRGERVERLVTDLRWGDLDARLGRELAGERLDGTPRRRQQLDAAVGYRGDGFEALPLAGQLFGTSRYRLGLRRWALPGGGAEHTARLSASFDPGPWSWGLDHRRHRRQALGARAAHRHSTRLHLELPVGHRLTLRPALEQVTRQPATAAPVQRHWRGHLAAAAEVVPRRMDARLDLHARRDRGALRARVLSAHGGLDWALATPADAGDSRVRLTLDGGLEYADPAHGEGVLRSYRLQANVEMAWAP